MNGCRMNCCLFRIPRMIRGEISSDTITIPEIGKNSKRIVVRETGYLRFLEMIPRGYSRGKGSSAMPAAGLFRGWSFASILKFRHIPAVFKRQMGSLAGRVFPLADPHRMKKGSPELLVSRLISFRRQAGLP